MERWVEAVIEKGDPIQKERVERVIYPERFEQSFEEMMFTRKECRLSIYHLDKMDLEEINYLWEWKTCRKRDHGNCGSVPMCLFQPVSAK